MNTPVPLPVPLPVPVPVQTKLNTPVPLPVSTSVPVQEEIVPALASASVDQKKEEESKGQSLEDLRKKIKDRNAERLKEHGQLYELLAEQNRTATGSGGKGSSLTHGKVVSGKDA